MYLSVFLLEAPALLDGVEETAALDKLLPGRRERLPAGGGRQARLAAYLLEAVILQRQTGLKREQLALAYSSQGKPYLPSCPSCRYNLSHSGTAVLLGVSDEEIGVDIETIRSLRPQVLRRCFTPGETAWCGTDAERMTALWTQKEAYSKWTGRGLPQVLAGIDTQRDETARLLTTFRQGEWAASVCSAVPFRKEQLHRMTWDELRRAL